METHELKVQGYMLHGRVMEVRWDNQRTSKWKQWAYVLVYECIWMHMTCFHLASMIGSLLVSAWMFVVKVSLGRLLYYICTMLHIYNHIYICIGDVFDHFLLPPLWGFFQCWPAFCIYFQLNSTTKICNVFPVYLGFFNPESWRFSTQETSKQQQRTAAPL